MAFFSTEVEGGILLSKMPAELELPIHIPKDILHAGYDWLGVHPF